MNVINLSQTPSLLGSYLAEIRDVHIQKDPLRFRRNIERIGQIMALEISKQLPYTPHDITTPLGTCSIPLLGTPVVLATILRAGLPLHQGFLDMFDRAENAFLSAYRREVTQPDGTSQLEIVSEYLAAPCLDGKTLLVADPMLATGKSMEISVRALLTHGRPVHIHLACTIGTPQAIQYLQENLPTDIPVTLWCAAIDPILNEHNYIVPGLGDAGDLCFGPKL